MAFIKGKSGNPAGKPKGTINKVTRLGNELAQLHLLPHAEEIIKACVKLAKKGHPRMIEVCMDRLIPRVSTDLTHFEEQLAVLRQMIFNSNQTSTIQSPHNQEDDDD